MYETGKEWDCLPAKDRHSIFNVSFGLFIFFNEVHKLYFQKTEKMEGGSSEAPISKPETIKAAWYCKGCQVQLKV